MAARFFCAEINAYYCHTIVHTGVTPSRDSLRSQSPDNSENHRKNSPCLPLGEGARRSGRMRASPLPMGEVPGRGGEGGFTLSVGFAASSPRVGAKGKRIANQCAHWG